MECSTARSSGTPVTAVARCGSSLPDLDPNRYRQQRGPYQSGSQKSAHIYLTAKLAELNTELGCARSISHKFFFADVVFIDAGALQHLPHFGNKPGRSRQIADWTLKTWQVPRQHLRAYGARFSGPRWM
jgi:hypothetical protein